MIDDLHREVDDTVSVLVEIHGARLQCRRGCADCCVDGITVFEVEAERIRRGTAGSLRNADAHPPGRCAFLGDEGECRIYEVRPYVCRTQGLPLRWIDEEAEAEYRDICPLNEEGAPVEELAPGDCLTLGLFEERLARMNGSSERIPLRALFEQLSSGSD